MNGNDKTAVLPPPESEIEDAAAHARSLQRIIAELSPLKSDDRRRLIETISTFFGLNSFRAELATTAQAAPPHAPNRPNAFQFSEGDEVPSAKAFMLTKSPKTDIERVACLAYYLSRYRGAPHFKTRDITAANTESAHRPFSNAAYAVENAAKAGLLVPSVKGSKQLSALGEQFVEALPDRGAASEVFERLRHRRGSGTGKAELAKATRE
jgi:hypothetical protein